MNLQAKRDEISLDKSLRVHVLRSGFGSAVIQACNRVLALLLSIVLARSLGADDYGIYTYAFAIMGLILVAAEAGVPTLIMREVAASKGQTNWNLMRGAIVRGNQWVILVSMVVTIMGLLVLAMVADRISEPLFYTSLWMLILVPISALTKTIAHAMRGLHHVVTGMMTDMLLSPLVALIIVSCLFLLLPEMRKPQYAMAAQAVAGFMVLLVSIWFFKRYILQQYRKDIPEFRDLLWFKSTIPFIAIGAIGLIYYKTDILVLGWFRPLNEVGIYQVAIQGSILVAFAVHAAGNVINPLFSSLIARDELQKLQSITTFSARSVLVFSLPIVATFVAFGGMIAGWIFGDEFKEAHRPLAILALGQLATASFGFSVFLLNMSGHESTAAKILAITATLNLALNLVLVPTYGMEGAALATAISTALLHLMHFDMAKRLVGISAAPIRFS